jgi:hypothetical protein
MLPKNRATVAVFNSPAGARRSLRTELCIARALAQHALPTRVCGCTLALATRVIRKNAGANN